MAKQILILDNDKEHSDALRTYLERQQYRVAISTATAENELFSKNDLCDIVLVNPFGDENFASDLESIKKRSPIVQTIVFATPENMDSAMDHFGLDVDDYLGIPLNSKALDLALSRAEKRISLNRKMEQYSERLSDFNNAQILFNQLFDEVPCYISVQNRDLRITAANRRFKKHFGDAIGGHCFEIYKHRTYRCEKCPVMETFEDGQIHSRTALK